MVNPYYFTDRELQVGYKSTLDSHPSSHVNAKVNMKPNILENDIRYDNSYLKEVVTFFC